MKVLMLSLDPNITHPERDAGRRMEEYATLVDKLSIVLFSSGGRELEKGNLTIYPTSSFKPLSFFKGFVLGYQLLRKERYNLITLQEPFLLSFVAFLLAHLFRVPLEVQVHSTIFSPFWKGSWKNNTLYQFVARMFIPHATCIRAASERIKHELITELNIPESKISVTPVFTDTKRIAEKEPQFNLHKKYPQFDFIVLAASRLVKMKNVELAIDAVKKLSQENSRIGLVVVGEGSHKDVLVNYAKGSENIVFEGWTDDIVSYYKSADVFVLTSQYEGWGVAVIEAMASGTAVVMTDVGCAGEVVRNGEDGIVIPVGDGGALIEALHTLYNHPEKRREFAEAGQKRVLTMSPRTEKEYLERYKKNFERCAKA